MGTATSGSTGTIAVMRGRQRLTTLVLLILLGSAIPVGFLRAASSDWASGSHGAARLISAVEATGSTAQLDLGLQLRLTPGWHTYWRTPGDAGIAPTIDWNGSENLAHAEIAWPAPRRLPSVGGLETVGYEDSVVLPITATPAHPGAPLHLHAEVDYASCKDVCIPYHASLDLVLPAGLAHPGPEAPLIAAARNAVPGDLASARLALLDAVVGPEKSGAILAVRVAGVGMPLQAPDLFVEGLVKGSPGRPVIELVDTGRMVTFQVPIPGGTPDALANAALSVTLVDGVRVAEAAITPRLGTMSSAPGQTMRLPIISLALLGGLVLNLMPCVLPVLSLKLLALVGYAGAERRLARLGLLAAAAGVVVSFGVLATALIALKTAGAAIGWGIQFQQPWFLAGMALVTTLFAANLWDWLPLALPGGAASRVGSMRGGSQVSDAFLLGAFATFLATSCSAPFVGTAIGFATGARASRYRTCVRRARPRHGGTLSRCSRGAAAGGVAATTGAMDELATQRPRFRAARDCCLVARRAWHRIGIDCRIRCRCRPGGAASRARLASPLGVSPLVSGAAAVALAALAVLVPTLHGRGFTSLDRTHRIVATIRHIGAP